MMNGIQQQIPTIVGQSNAPFQPHNASQAPQTTTTSVIASQLQQISVPPRFHFNDINSYSLATCLANHMVVKNDVSSTTSFSNTNLNHIRTRYRWYLQLLN